MSASRATTSTPSSPPAPSNGAVILIRNPATVHPARPRVLLLRALLAACTAVLLTGCGSQPRAPLPFSIGTEEIPALSDGAAEAMPVVFTDGRKSQTVRIPVSTHALAERYVATLTSPAHGWGKTSDRIDVTLMTVTFVKGNHALTLMFSHQQGLTFILSVPDTGAP